MDYKDCTSKKPTQTRNLDELMGKLWWIEDISILALVVLFFVEVMM